MVWTAADIPDQAGRVAVVTGANGGLGYETARALAARGAHVVMAARNQHKASDARNRILAAAPTATLEIVPLDLAKLASVAEAAAITARHDRLDLLINNAGIMATPEGRTDDGFERQFGTNHLGHFAPHRPPAADDAAHTWGARRHRHLDGPPHGPPGRRSRPTGRRHV